MEIGFDKEIDAILRKARANEVAASFDSHLGADEISAFAENALPEPARQLSTAHLADCTRCRKILSNVIVLNSEAETETDSSVVPAEITAVKIPWYRKFFVFPQIAYAMGALVVLFSGFFGYLVLQNLTSSKSDFSFSTDKSAPLEKPAPAANSSVSSSSNAAAANSSAPANAPTATNSAPVYSSNTATANIAPTERKSGLPEATPATTNQPALVLDEKKPTDSKGELDSDLAKIRTENEGKKPNIAAGASQESNQTRAKNKKETTLKDAQPTTDEEIAPKLKTTRSAPESPRKQDSQAGKTERVDGKTFNNVGGIWFDSTYTNQKQKTVTRGTSDYQKLDSGLRSIADKFSETVVVLWKSKAYRIQ